MKIFCYIFDRGFCREVLFFLLIGFFSTHFSINQSWAQNGPNQGVLKGIIFGSDSILSDSKISNRLIVDLRLEDNYQSTNRKNEYLESRANGRFYSRLNLDKNFSLNSYLYLGQMNQQSENQRRDQLPQGGGDRAFEDEGIYIRELNLEYAKDNYALVAGKFDLDFGTAWRFDRGLWTYEIASNYQQRERLGFTTLYKLGDAKKTGKYEFGFGVFTNDRKHFDNSIITNRDSDSKSDAMPGDTSFAKSYVASLNINYDFGEKLGWQEKLSYHFAYINLAVNERASSVTPTKIDDQKGFVLGIDYQLPVSEKFMLDILIEYADMKNFGGDSDINENYFTSNIIGRIYKNWNVTLGYANRRNLEVEAAGYDQGETELSFGYDFAKIPFFDRITLQAGYKNLRTDYKTSLETQNILGTMARFYKNF